MAVAEPVSAETLQLAEGPLGELQVVRALDHAADQLVLEVDHPPVNLKVAMARRSWSTSPTALNGYPYGLLLALLVHTEDSFQADEPAGPFLT